jgi:hypothetical protein
LAAKIADHVQRPDAAIAGATMSAADAALFETAKDFERDLWPRGDDRSSLFSSFSADGFATLLESLEAQMAHDAGARELAQLFGAGARGKLPVDGSVRLERLACGMRLCAAHFEASGRDGDLPRLGYNSMASGTLREDGGMSHRVIFSLDPELHIARPPPARRGG